MKRILICILLLLIAFTCSFAQKQVKVTLKNGTTIVGEAKSFDPLSSIVLVVADMESTIPMDKVANVEEVKSESEASSTVPMEQIPTKDNPLIVTDHADYPDSVVIDIAGDPYTFILVRGGDYLMGYDGDGSRSMHSEPMHRVKLTTFYISRKLLKGVTVNKLLGDKGGPHKTYIYLFKKKRIKILDAIKSVVDVPLRLPTDAEWEYAAVGPQKKKIFNQTDINYEVCQDVWYKFSDGPLEIDPIHDASDDFHVSRIFKGNKNLPYTRIAEDGHNDGDAIRLAIKAKDLLKK